MRVEIVGEQQLIVQHKILPRATLHHGKLLKQNAAGARGFHRLRHVKQALLGERIKVNIGANKGCQQGQNGKRKANQQYF